MGNTPKSGKIEKINDFSRVFSLSRLKIVFSLVFPLFKSVSDGGWWGPGFNLSFLSPAALYS